MCFPTEANVSQIINKLVKGIHTQLLLLILPADGCNRTCSDKQTGTTQPIVVLRYHVHKFAGIYSQIPRGE